MRLGRLLFLIAMAVAATFVLRTFIVEGIYIATGSMEPKLPVGTHVFMDKLTLRFRSPQRQEIIVFSPPVSADKEMVKRVIGIPGDVIELRDKKVWLNSERQDEDYARHTRAGEKLVRDNLGPITVPPNHLFVLGDNRDESYDSTAWEDPKTGEPIYFVPYSSIRGLIRGFY